MASPSVARKRLKKANKREAASGPEILGEPPAFLFPSRAELAQLAAVVGIAVATAVACSFTVRYLSRAERPFCDTIQDGLDPSLLYTCDPCPDNGECSNGKLECVHGYKKCGRTCIEDGNANQQTIKLKHFLERRICESHARVICGYKDRLWFGDVDIMEILEEESLENFGGSKASYLMYSKQKAMDAAETFLDTRVLTNGSKEYKCPESKAQIFKSLRCRIGQWIERNTIILLISLSLFIGVLRYLSIIYWRQVRAKRAELLYQQVCDILEDNAVNKSEPWIVASWLRDHLLLPNERKDITLWKKVEEMIHEDSRIDRYQKLIKGDMKIVLEWQMDCSLSSKIKMMQAAKRPKVISKDPSSSSRMKLDYSNEVQQEQSYVT